MNWMYWSLLGLHIICSVLVLVGIRLRLLRVRSYMFGIMLFLPIWGLILILVLHFRIAFNEEDSLEMSVERMQLENDMYKSLTIDDADAQKTIVPIEEALVVNSAMERRALIMDVLNNNPKEYVEFLQKAGNNEDTEVVHYAVTAMVEISKENDHILQQLEHQFMESPNDYSVLERYADFIWGCLEQNLMQGQMELINRNLFSNLIEKKSAIHPVLQDYVRLVDNELHLKNYTAAAHAIDFMAAQWPNTQEYYLSKFQYLIALQQGEEIKALLKEMENNDTYFSAKTKEMLAFWKS